MDSLSFALDHFEKCKAALLEGQSQVEALVSFMKDRVTMEESYAKKLLNLSKLSLAIDGKSRLKCRTRRRAGSRPHPCGEAL